MILKVMRARMEASCSSSEHGQSSIMLKDSMIFLLVAMILSMVGVSQDVGETDTRVHDWGGMCRIGRMFRARVRQLWGRLGSIEGSVGGLTSSVLRSDRNVSILS